MKKIAKILHMLPFCILFSPFIIAALILGGIVWLLFGWQDFDDSDDDDYGQSYIPW